MDIQARRNMSEDDQPPNLQVAREVRQCQNGPCAVPAPSDSEALDANIRYPLSACRSSLLLHLMGLFAFQGVRGCFAKCTSRSGDERPQATNPLKHSNTLPQPSCVHLPHRFKLQSWHGCMALAIGPTAQRSWPVPWPVSSLQQAISRSSKQCHCPFCPTLQHTTDNRKCATPSLTHPRTRANPQHKQLVAPMPTWEEQQLCIGATFRVAATNGADASRRVAIEGFCQSVDYLLASVQVRTRRATRVALSWCLCSTGMLE